MAEEKVPKSWAPEVIADSTGRWCGNALRFAKKEDAEAWAYDLSLRWTLVRAWRAAPSDDPVNEPDPGYKPPFRVSL